MVSADVEQAVLSALLRAEDSGITCMGSIELGKQAGVPIDDLLPLIEQLATRGLVTHFHPEVPISLVLSLTALGRMRALSYEPDVQAGAV